MDHSLCIYENMMLGGATEQGTLFKRKRQLKVNGGSHGMVRKNLVGGLTQDVLTSAYFSP